MYAPGCIMNNLSINIIAVGKGRRNIVDMKLHWSRLDFRTRLRIYAVENTIYSIIRPFKPFLWAMNAPRCIIIWAL